MCEFYGSNGNGFGDIWLIDNPINFSSIDDTIQHLIINVIIKYENHAETHRVNLGNTLEHSSDLHLRNVIVFVIVT